MTTINCACGGEYENTPSRKSRHDQTNRHVGYVAAQQKVAREQIKNHEKAYARKADLSDKFDAREKMRQAKPEPISVKKKPGAPIEAKVAKVTKASVVRELLEANPSKSLTWIATEASARIGSVVSYEYAWDVRKAVADKAGA